MRTSRATFSSIVCGLALRAGAAAGQTLPAVAEPQPPAAPPIAAEPTAAPPETRWYGWQTLAPDAVAVGLAMVAAHVGEKADQVATARGLLALSAGIFLADGPIVHALHGQPGRAGWSLALRLGLTLLGGAAGLGVGESCRTQYVYDHEGCQFEYGFYGLVFGAATAALVDAAIVGHEPVTARARSAPSIAFTPLRDGGALSLSGRF